jgi:hypothetical protein
MCVRIIAIAITIIMTTTITITIIMTTTITITIIIGIAIGRLCVKCDGK